MCEHCRPAPALDPPRRSAPDLGDLDFSGTGGPDDIGPVFTATYWSDCGGDCGEKVRPGDEARMVEGEAVHADCV
jgi:hypothetical protein